MISGPDHRRQPPTAILGGAVAQPPPGCQYAAMKRLATLIPIIALGSPTALQGQSVEVQAPAIDTVIIVTQNVFTPEQAEKNFAFRFMNGIHIVTKHDVIWSELMFRPGEPADSTVMEESERNLRIRELFQLRFDAAGGLHQRGDFLQRTVVGGAEDLPRDLLEHGSPSGGPGL